MIINPTGSERSEKKEYVADALTVSPGYGSTSMSPRDGHLITSVTVSGDSNLVPENIKHDVTIFGVTGTYKTTETVTYTLPWLKLDMSGLTWVADGSASYDSDDMPYYRQMSYRTGVSPAYGKFVTEQKDGVIREWKSEDHLMLTDYSYVPASYQTSSYHLYGWWTIGTGSHPVSTNWVWTDRTGGTQTSPTLPNGTYGVVIGGFVPTTISGYLLQADMAGVLLAETTATMTVQDDGATISFTDVTLPDAVTNKDWVVLGASRPTNPGSLSFICQVRRVTSFKPA